eukprot:TRINITY_DN5046_c0_g1_i1.p1 TRINITY_DN5046_c0_g1~~TRINITY_DN5046_c0_g1_i1.p1  ORF type:complete len:900 (+),score=213.07 TRINITY_DN5046_c0_g1_i1:144-2702(+)
MPPLRTAEQANAVRKFAFAIWNRAVRLAALHKTPPEVCAKIRHKACDFLSLAILSFERTPESVLVTLMKFLGFTGKAWAELNNYELSQSCFTNAMEVWGKLQQLYQAPSDAELGTRRSCLFSILCWRAETAWAMQQKEVTYELFSRAKDLLEFLPSEASYLAAMCFNLGLSHHTQRDFAEAVRWLTECVDVNDRAPQSVARQASALRLLADSYLELGNAEQALNSISLANKSQDHPAGLYILLRVFLLQKNFDQAEHTAEALVKRSDSTLEINMAVPALLITHKRNDCAIRCLQQLCDLYGAEPEKRGAVLIQHLETLVRPPLRDLDAAKALIQSALAGHHDGGLPLDYDVADHLSNVMWDLGANYFQDRDFAHALEWFTWACKLLSLHENHKVCYARCLRIVGQCHLQLSQYPEAATAARQSLALDASLAAHFVLFNALEHTGDGAQAKEELKQICQHSTDAWQGCLELCAQTAFELDQLDTAIEALSAIVSNCRSEALPSGRTSVIVRNLVTLLLRPRSQAQTESASSSGNLEHVAVPTLATCCHYFKLLCDWATASTAVVFGAATADEVSWFHAVAWNVGCAACARGEPETGRTAFASAACFASAAGQPDAQLKALLLCLGCLFEVADRSSPACVAEAPEQLSKDALGTISRCRELCAQLRDQKPLALLQLMEFRARVMVRDPGLREVLRTTLQVPGITGNTLLHMADVCGTADVDTCCEALRMALRLFTSQPGNYPKIACTFRSLIVLQASREDAQIYFAEVLQILQGLPATQYPPLELQWLVATAFNNGIYYARVHDTARAEEWMGRAIALVKYHPDRAVLEPDLQKAYTELLGRKAKAAAASQTEQ